jgi:hypothetical protein
VLSCASHVHDVTLGCYLLQIAKSAMIDDHRHLKQPIFFTGELSPKSDFFKIFFFFVK